MEKLSLTLLRAAMFLGFAGTCQADPVMHIGFGSQARSQAQVLASGNSPAAYTNARRLSQMQLDLEPISRRSQSKRQSFEFVQGGTVVLELMPGEVFTFDGQAVDSFDAATSSWIGRSDGEEGYLVLTVHDGKLVGQAGVGARRFKLIGDVGKPVVVREEPLETGGDCSSEYETKLLPESAEPAVPKATAKFDMTAKASASSTKVLDVLVTYSTEAEQYYGSWLVSAVENLSAAMNQSFYASGLNASTRIVGYRHVPNSNGTNDQYQVTTYIDEIHNSDTPFTNLSTWRNDLKADVVVHLATLAPNGGACGVARIMVQSSTSSTTFGAVVIADCPSSQHVFTHEIGHLLGGQHSSKRTQTSATFWNALPYPKSLGYTQPASNGFRTMMGDETGGGLACNMATGCPRINRWSNPIQTATLNGSSQALGTTFVDSAMGQTRTTDMVQTLGGFFDPVFGVSWDGTLSTVTRYRSPNYGVPSVPTGLTATRSGSSLNANWAAGTGVIGWYAWGRRTTASGSFVASGKTPSPQTALTVPSTGGVYFSVAACNAAGCSSYVNIGPL